MLFSTELRAVDATRNCHRRYRIDVAHDLFGACVISVTFGRIAAKGRTFETVVATDDDARRVVAALLRRRASLRRRIGVAYRVVKRTGCESWQSFPIDLETNPRASRLVTSAAEPTP